MTTSMREESRTRPGKRRFTPEQDERIFRLSAEGVGWQEIGRQLGTSARSCYLRHRKNLKEQQESPERFETRICLRCRAAFQSSGPGNRLCSKCRLGNTVVEHALVLQTSRS
jgi:hypothetical protein